MQQQQQHSTNTNTQRHVQSRGRLRRRYRYITSLHGSSTGAPPTRTHGRQLKATHARTRSDWRPPAFGHLPAWHTAKTAQWLTAGKPGPEWACPVTWQRRRQSLPPCKEVYPFPRAWSTADRQTDRQTRSRRAIGLRNAYKRQDAPGRLMAHRAQ